MSMKNMEELKQKLGNSKMKENQKNIEDRLLLVEKKITKHKRKFEDMQMAIDLFKTYGFQPRQFDELMEEMKISKGFKMQERSDKMILKTAGINPIEKFQMIFIMIAINVLMMAVFYSLVIK